MAVVARGGSDSCSFSPARTPRGRQVAHPACLRAGFELRAETETQRVYATVFRPRQSDILLTSSDEDLRNPTPGTADRAQRCRRANKSSVADDWLRPLT